MELHSEGLAVLLTLLPGFLAVRVRDFFLPPRVRQPFDQVIEALAFSIACYLCMAAMTVLGSVSGLRIVPDPPALATAAAGTPGIFRYFAGLSLIALVLGIISGVIAGRDLHYRVARGLRLTSRTGREDVWQDVFTEVGGGWMMLTMSDGRRARGWALYYSDRGAQPSVFLANAAWVGDDGSVDPIRGAGVLVAERARICYAEFLDPEEEEEREQEHDEEHDDRRSAAAHHLEQASRNRKAP